MKLIYEMASPASSVDVPLAPGVRFDELTAGDTNPVFVTAVVAAAEASRNGRVYTADIMRSLAQQINDRRPPMQRGHLRDTDRPYAHPAAVGRWVGARFDESSGKLYAKAYVYPTSPATRDEIRTATATRARIGFSLYGTGDVSESGDVTHYDLESIDLVHPARVGLPSASMEPLVTAESIGENEMDEYREVLIDLMLALGVHDASIGESVQQKGLVAAARDIAKSIGERGVPTEETITSWEDWSLRESFDTPAQDASNAQRQLSEAQVLWG